MNKKAVKKIKKTLSVLQGLPLSKIARRESTLFLHFGEMIEIDSRSKVDENGNPLKVLSGQYAFQTQCFCRISYGRGIILGENDWYLPSAALLSYPDFTWERFQDAVSEGNMFYHDLEGNNRLDETIADKFDKPKGYKVYKIKVTPLGDVLIKFSNRHRLEIRVNISADEWCWRFFRSADNYDLLAVTGKTLEK